MTAALFMTKNSETLYRPQPISPVGRSFILGEPDLRGLYHIFIGSQVWKIEPGKYRAGDRVHIVSAAEGMLVVQCEPIQESAASAA